VRESDKLPHGPVSTLFPHDFRFGHDITKSDLGGGIVQLVVSSDLSTLLTCGGDGSIVAFKWRSRSSRVAQLVPQVDASELAALKLLPNWIPENNKIILDAKLGIPAVSLDSPASEPTPGHGKTFKTVFNHVCIFFLGFVFFIVFLLFLFRSG
jgi:hypothetical protein